MVDNEALLMFEDTVLIEGLEHAGIDFIIADLAFPMPVLAHRLGVPWAYFTPECHSWEARAPFNPSYVPFLISTSSDQMSFTERAISLVKYIGGSMMIPFMGGEDVVAKFAPGKEALSYSNL